MQIDSFDVAENQQALEYFSFVRESMQTTQLNYWIGNPSVSILNGTLHLRPGQPVQTSQQISNHQLYLKQYRNLFTNKLEQKQILRTLILTGIPNNKNPIQVCDRLKPYLDWILQIRVIKMNGFKYYGLLMLMADGVVAKKLFYEILGQQYNGLEIDRFLIREIQACTIAQTGASKMDDEPIFQPRKRSAINTEQISQKMSAQQIFLKTSKQPIISTSPRKKQHSVSSQSTINEQLQKQSDPTTTCSICFQDTEGTLISILCSHYFHVKCLSQWKQNICPLCRYHQQPPLIKFCQKCNQCEGLWVCLVCGVRLCCGQDNNILGSGSHIYEHYVESHHRLSMDVETKFIFDASQPAFLHQMLYRQIMKNDEGAEMKSAQKQSKKGKKTKLSQKISEYEQSISEQMHRQRMYFEQNISKQVKKLKQSVKQKRKQLNQHQAQIVEIEKQIEQTDKKKQEYEINTSKLQKQLKIIGDVQKYWKQLSDKSKHILKQKEQIERQELQALDEMIALKKEELKDFIQNIQINDKIKSNIGKDQVSTTLILGNVTKDKKKKK